MIQYSRPKISAKAHLEALRNLSASIILTHNYTRLSALVKPGVKPYLHLGGLGPSR